MVALNQTYEKNKCNIKIIECVTEEELKKKLDEIMNRRITECYTRNN